MTLLTLSRCSWEARWDCPPLHSARIRTRLLVFGMTHGAVVDNSESSGRWIVACYVAKRALLGKRPLEALLTSCQPECGRRHKRRETAARAAAQRGGRDANEPHRVIGNFSGCPGAVHGCGRLQSCRHTGAWWPLAQRAAVLTACVHWSVRECFRHSFCTLRLVCKPRAVTGQL